ncbi:MAG: pyridoxine 5'-phosphate synthase [Candidatus Omnitrophica bacterium]|nr:pyridoxine 5'-phosphate synthase [Candidatus Omnitrophota bacterium]
MKLGVNVDHVAGLRQARGGMDPDPVMAARICQKAGVHAVVMHLREDRRHIQDGDLFRVKEVIRIKLNLEMSAAPSIVKTAARLCPDQATLVPERRQEKTTEGGINLFRNERAVRNCLERCRKKGIEVSFFIDPDPRQLEKAKKMGADAVEFHTGYYADQQTPQGVEKEFLRLERAVKLACQMGVVPYAGHGLDYQNVKRVRDIRGLQELNIGYSIVTRALWVGFENAVREMLGLVSG